MSEKVKLLFDSGFEVQGRNKIFFGFTKIAEIQPDGSVSLFVKQNSEDAKNVKLDEFLKIMGNPIINNIGNSDFKKTTSVSAMNSILNKCQAKFGTLAKALEYAANN